MSDGKSRMKVLHALLAVTMMTLLCLCTDVSAAVSFRPADLRCEYLVNPLGIDEGKPRLSWISESDQRRQKQTAYHILVASSRQKLDENIGDLWDTGKVKSDRSIHVVYKGKELQSRMQCFWKVMIWDKDTKASEWSSPAMWSMGLLKQKDWQAQWIGWDADFQLNEEADKKLPLASASWIWYPVGSPAESVPGGNYFFRHAFQLPQGRKVRSAEIQFTADDAYTLWLNEKEVLQGTHWESCETAEVRDDLVSGTNIIAIQASNDGGAPSPAGLIGVMRITFQDGPPLTIVTGSEWKVSREEQQDWPTLEYSDAGWKNAMVLGQYGESPWGNVTSGQDQNRKRYLPSPHLRKDFTVSGQVSRASLYVTAQGHVEMHINGERVGDEYFMPGWTDYRKRIYYRTYDVTSMLNKSANTIGAILGDGWFRGNISILGQNQYGSKLRLMSQLHIDYTDGTSEIISSDPSWKASFGPILLSDMQEGETYDARREMTGWDEPGFDEQMWKTVNTGSGINPVIEAYPGVPVRPIEEMPTVKLTKLDSGDCVFDLGQNFSGWVRLKVQGTAGSKIVMRFAEMLKTDGSVYTANLRSARATDNYILKGEGEEIWQPHFTFHGFRYVQVSGLESEPAPDMVTGIAVHSDAPMSSSFACSNPMLNQLHSNIMWGQRSNYLEVPTDCPQRDERLGWTGDTQVFIRSGCYNQDAAAFFRKWIVDLMDTQTAEGTFGNQAPVFHGHGSPAWADAGIVCPWTIFKVYGDTGLVEKHYDAMVRFIEYCRSKGLAGPGGGFGDHLAIGSKTPTELISAAYFGHSTSLMVEMAETLGKTDDVAKYNKLFEDIRTHFQKTFVDADGKIAGDSQTGYCLALHYNMLTDKQRKQAAAHLVDRIKAKDYHLSVGFVGVPLLLPTLTEIGRSDLAYRLIQKKTYPSWGYSIEQGATTIWERWNSYTQKDGFGDVSMNSFNHYAYGACSEWMFRSMLGIESDGIGFKTITMKPEPGQGVSWAKGHYDSVHGRISSDWKVESKTFSWNVTIPPNTTATIYVPAAEVTDITESGRSVKRAEGVKFLRMDNHRAVFRLDSGTYEFVSKNDQGD